MVLLHYECAALQPPGLEADLTFIDPAPLGRAGLIRRCSCPCDGLATAGTGRPRHFRAQIAPAHDGPRNYVGRCMTWRMQPRLKPTSGDLPVKPSVNGRCIRSLTTGSLSKPTHDELRRERAQNNQVFAYRPDKFIDVMNFFSGRATKD